MIDFQSLTAVFFDADDTLYRVRESVGHHYAPILANHGLHFTQSEIDAVTPQAWKAIEEDYYNVKEHYHTSHERDSAIWRNYLEQVLFGLDVYPSQSDFEALYSDIHSHFATEDSRELHDFVVDFLYELNQLSFTTGVLTNNDRRIHKLIPDLGISEHLDYVFCAGDLGCRKPSQEVFKEIAKRIRVSPEKILYIGDSLDADYHGARNAGWQAVWYNRKKKELHEDVLHVYCFSEMIDWLRQSRS